MALPAPTACEPAPGGAPALAQQSFQPTPASLRELLDVSCQTGEPAAEDDKDQDTDSTAFSEASGSGGVSDDIFSKGDYFRLPPPPGLELEAAPALAPLPESRRTPLSIKAAVYVPKAEASGGDAGGKPAPSAAAAIAATTRGPQSRFSAASAATTAMMRNLPSTYSRTTLVELLEAHGFAGQFDLIYLPMDFGSQCNFGYAFLNLVSPEQACLFAQVFHGFSSWPGSRCRKVCAVHWAEVQGLQANLERYHRSGIMAQDILEEYKPAVFQGGRHVRLPPELPPPLAAEPPRWRRAPRRAPTQPVRY